MPTNPPPENRLDPQAGTPALPVSAPESLVYDENEVPADSERVTGDERPPDEPDPAA